VLHYISRIGGSVKNSTFFLSLNLRVTSIGGKLKVNAFSTGESSKRCDVLYIVVSDGLRFADDVGHSDHR